MFVEMFCFKCYNDKQFRKKKKEGKMDIMGIGDMIQLNNNKENGLSGRERERERDL
jgi:hypothetical protein